MMRICLPILAAACGIWLLRAAAPPADLAALKQAFQHPPDDARIMMRWWWFGSAVETPELEREMRTMKEGGIGGFEVQPVYPLTLDDPQLGLKNLPYLSPEFLGALTFTGQKARELGMRMDLTLCSGWPYGGPHVPITQAAGRLRVDRVPVAANSGGVKAPRIAEGEKLLAVFVGSGRDYRPIDVMMGDTLVLPADFREGTALFFISSRTRMMVKRAAVGAEGFVLDHYDRSAIDAHLSFVGEKLLGALSKTPPYAVFSDSLEVERSDWTPNFLAEFQKRRGYDLTPYLPSLAGIDIGPMAADIRHDWGLTLTELANENYLTPIREWAKRHGTLFRSQTYGTPPVSLSSNALVDLPEGEGSQWRHASSTRWASSASHLYNRPVTSSETWTWLHSPVFRATPLDMKAEADLHFLEGINQLIGHGWPYSPPQAGEPGWRFYAAAVFNNHNPWWMVMPDIALYLQRISYMLRQGEPANDVALYVPTDDIYAHFTLGNDSINKALDGALGPDIIPAILDAGFNFDLIDDGAIAHGGIPHKILVLPAVERMPAETRAKIEEYRRKGGIVIANNELSKLKTALAPDVATAPDVGVVHRKLPFAEVYFLANTANHPVHANATFRVKDLTPAWWNPVTGQISGAAVRPTNHVQLDLAPYESRVLVFSKQGEAVVVELDADTTHPIDISGNWKVTFEKTTATQTMDQLRTWTDDERTKYFSGKATYERNVTIPGERIGGLLYINMGEGAVVSAVERRSGSGMRAMLESPVREAAQVYVNGKLAGSVWCAPYEVYIGDLVHAGENAIRIVVANLALNELAKGPLPDYKALNARYGERFQAQDLQSLQPVPAGLLGPIRLIGRFERTP
jgi:hypothetical protein